MNILIIGSGGREHALAWKLASSVLVTDVYVAPGNGGTEGEHIHNVALAVEDFAGILSFVREKKIALVVPGPELPLTLGITDFLTEAGVACFGPSKACARLEGSKSFAKEIMKRALVPTAKAQVVSSMEQAREVLTTVQAPIVLKCDGLAQGKGVLICQSREEAEEECEKILEGQVFGQAGARLLIEEYLEGEEVSLLCVCDGKTARPLPSAQDHKRAFDNDCGLNTGGMGAYSPAPLLPDEKLESYADLCIRPILRVMAEDGTPFVGILYAGLMLTKDGPKVLEYNVRFGDPECQPILKRLTCDLASVFWAAVNGKLDAVTLTWTSQSALGVVIAKNGYPEKYAKGAEITGIAQAEQKDNVTVFHSGTKKEGAKLLSNGGRILCVTALGDTLKEARNACYSAVHEIAIHESFYRTDIGAKGLACLKEKAPKVLVLMGSNSDAPKMESCLSLLRSFGIPYLVTVSSAHRTPQRTLHFLKTQEVRGVKVVICAAGMAAHLAGACAAQTVLPVIGIPISSSALNGVDALYATVQMPTGFPVATVAIDGTKNAAWLAAQIVALEDDRVRERLKQMRQALCNDVESKGDCLMAKDAEVQQANV